MRFSLTRIAICACFAAFTSAAQADIYRCVDADGGTSYSDAPCPRTAKSKSNITDSVGACTTAECEEQRRQKADEARQRLRAEKEELSELTAKRRQAEADYERARLEELRYRKAVEDRLAALADEAAQGINHPYYDDPGYAWYPGVVRPCGRRCNLQPSPHHDVSKRPKERSVRGREIPDSAR
jgi:uncharacterized protein DUF4124